MQHKISMDIRFDNEAIRRAALESQFGVRGDWKLVCRSKRTGEVKWTDEISNLVTNEGLNHLLDVTLSGGSQDTSWFVGLTDGTPTAAAADTLASHSGWAEISDYDETNRVSWVDGGVSSQTVSNSASPAVFTIDDTVTVGGAFLASVNSGTSGILYAVGAFTAGDKALSDDDELSVTATFTAAAAS